jgi:ABC-type amino acid transport substrate-binding protein
MWRREFGCLVRYVCLCSALTLSLMSVANATEPTRLRMVFFPFPPFVFSDETGAPRGELVDRFRAMCRIAGFTPEFFEAPAPRARQMIREGEADVLLTANTAPELAGAILSSAQPIDKLTVNVYSIGRDPDIRVRDDLAGKRVIVQQRFTYAGLREWMNNPANGVIIAGEAPDIESSVRMLVADRAPYLIQYRNNFDATVKKLKLTQDFRAIQLSSTVIYINVSRKTPEAESVLKRLSDADAEAQALPRSW